MEKLRPITEDGCSADIHGLIKGTGTEQEPRDQEVMVEGTQQRAAPSGLDEVPSELRPVECLPVC